MRALRILLVITVVLGGLFVAADRAAVWFAESEVADQIKKTQNLSGSASVSIKGFPFLTQAAGRQLDEVEVDLTDVEATASGQRVLIGKLEAVLNDVEIKGNFSGAVAARAKGTARISYEELTKASEEGFTVSYGGDGKVKVSGEIRVKDRALSQSVLSTVSVADGSTIRVRADKIPAGEIPGVENLVREKTDFDSRIGGLPIGLKLSSVEPTADGIVITVTGKDVSLAS
ncbi:DUF2993 domain-containing protein [Streptomyces sp. NPDC050504]|uniref:DUF2993 domain-containing protein n=1 Tax=Streptomyces sp. NPDC050504 TaxID=3365618 RepID=UPI0037975CC7